MWCCGGRCQRFGFEEEEFGFGEEGEGFVIGSRSSKFADDVLKLAVGHFGEFAVWGGIMRMVVRCWIGN